MKKQPLFNKRHYDFFAEYFGVKIAKELRPKKNVVWNHDYYLFLLCIQDDAIKIFKKDNKNFDGHMFRTQVLNNVVELNKRFQPKLNPLFGTGGRENECYQG